MGNQNAKAGTGVPTGELLLQEPPRPIKDGATIQTLKKGDGKTFPQPSQRVLVNYTGYLENGGPKFDSSYDRADPFAFTIGQGQVIQCWDEGVAMMSVGERALLKCPANTAYGVRGSPKVIPPGAGL